MPHFDLPPEQLRNYRPELAEPADFDEFWSTTLAAADAHDLHVTATPVDTGLTLVDTFDVRFPGYGGSPVSAWLHLPARRVGPLPAVVEYVGYGGGRGLAHERILYAAAGYAHLIMDTRGQGSSWSVGDTPDPAADSGGPAHPGFMTRGILDPHTYYYRRVFTDAVRAVRAVRVLDAVDPARVVVTGASQGGGISLAVAGLVDDLAAVMTDVPFLCDFPRATTLVDTLPYAEVARYLKAHRDHVDPVYRTLGYVDGVSHARRATAPALFSVALMDDVCPPSTVYAAYNCYAGVKEMREYPFNNHEGGQGFHDREKLTFLRRVVPAPPAG
ncbi:cephalosporin-C deacetylase [Micromonospora nigra]|uniref:Cephalosporin-C deacetylase n=1 Tax=Micromonospora nigra TaxID=145857 RepID=A0A1C6R9R4_9ACTN|nr:acetylxylan esterase [Micromonospora nigra]SCL13858.1 cephalosporin-C deacetylase [Micromonospora nigra]